MACGCTYFDCYNLAGRNKLGFVHKRESALAYHLKDLVDLVDALILVFLSVNSVVEIQEVILGEIQQRVRFGLHLHFL